MWSTVKELPVVARTALKPDHVQARQIFAFGALCAKTSVAKQGHVADPGARLDMATFEKSRTIVQDGTLAPATRDSTDARDSGFETLPPDNRDIVAALTELVAAMQWAP